MVYITSEVKIKHLTVAFNDISVSKSKKTTDEINFENLALADIVHNSRSINKMLMITQTCQHSRFGQESPALSKFSPPVRFLFYSIISRFS